MYIHVHIKSYIYVFTYGHNGSSFVCFFSGTSKTADDKNNRHLWAPGGGSSAYTDTNFAIGPAIASAQRIATVTRAHRMADFMGRFSDSER